MLIATKSTNLQQQQLNKQQQQQQEHINVTLVGSNVIKPNNNKQFDDVDNKNVLLATTKTKLTEFACGKKEDDETLLPCDTEAKQRHEALAKKWNMKYMQYKNNNNNNNNVKELDKQLQNADWNTELNMKSGGGGVVKTKRGRRPSVRGASRGIYRGNVTTKGKEMPANSLYAAAMLTVAKMEAKRGSNNRLARIVGGGRGGNKNNNNNNNRTKARLYATIIGNTTTNSSAESCNEQSKTTTTKVHKKNTIDNNNMYC